MAVSQSAPIQRVLQNVHLLQLSFQVLLDLHRQRGGDVDVQRDARFLQLVTRISANEKKQNDKTPTECQDAPPHLVQVSSQGSVWKAEFGSFHNDAAFHHVAEGEKIKKIKKNQTNSVNQDQLKEKRKKKGTS